MTHVLAVADTYLANKPVGVVAFLLWVSLVTALLAAVLAVVTARGKPLHVGWSLALGWVAAAVFVLAHLVK